MHLQSQIAAQKTALTELKQSLELATNPPSLKIDKTQYPALDRIESLLAQAKSSDEQKSMVANLKKEIAVEEKAIAQLEAQFTDAVDQLVIKIGKSQGIAARINEHYSCYLQAVGELIQASQDMNELRCLAISPNSEPLRVSAADRLALSNAIAWDVDNGGNIVARLHHFALEF